MTCKAAVVDDDAASASVVARLLRRLDVEAVVCTEAEGAVPLALREDIDLVCLDLSMPRLDGHQALTLIRSHEHSRRMPSVPVIAVTGRVGVEDRAEVLAGGFAAHLGKPVQLEALRAAVQRAWQWRAELQRSRDSVDQPSLQSLLAQLRARSVDPALQTGFGLALAVEQQGRGALRQAMLQALGGRDTAAYAALDEFARLMRALGASRLGRHLDEVMERLGSVGAELELATVLARAELDRVVFTLREQARA